jgi:aminoglycoside phosphotransferase (APT) family kinase protein
MPVTLEQVRALVASQFPHWAGLVITPVLDSGTDHALYLLGDALVVRLPIIEWAVEQVETDQNWLPILAPQLTLRVPIPAGIGEPGQGYPWPWLVVPWISGQTPSSTNLDMHRAAKDLGNFITSLHAASHSGGGPVKTGTARGAPLVNLDEGIRALIKEHADEIDIGAVRSVWDEAVSAPPWDGPRVWIHGDLTPGNLIVHERRLAAVIDFGGLGLGDPAPDLAPAWNLFDGSSREIFRDTVGYDEATWSRAKGWVLAPALQALGYYRHSRSEFVTAALQRIGAVLDRG